jgi:hypothetical protein
MEQTDSIVLLELRFSALYFEKQVENRIKILSDRISRYFLSTTRQKIMLPNTNVINVVFLNRDIVKNKDLVMGFGSKKAGWIGVIHMPISEREIKELDDDGKRRFFLGIIFNVLKTFSKDIPENIELIDDAYRRIMESDFFAPYSKPIQASNKSIICQIESRENFGNADYQLCVKSKVSDQVKIFFITRKDYPFFDEMLNLTNKNANEIVLNTPQIFNPIQWEGDYFVMYWGKEKYVFDSEKEQIVREI